MPIVIPAGTFEETLLLEAGETLVGLKAARVLLADGPGEDLPAAPEGDEVEESVITGTSFHTISVNTSPTSIQSTSTVTSLSQSRTKYLLHFRRAISRRRRG